MLSYSKEKKELFLKEIKGKKYPFEVEKILLKKARKYLRALNILPSIKMIGICNSLSMNACHTNSDIDLFIITKKNRLWTARFLISIYFIILGQRKTRKKHVGKFCLSFFITEENLNLKGIAIDDDIYLYFWILFMKPLIIHDTIYERFLEANTSWCDFDVYKDIIENNKKYIKKERKGKTRNSKLGDIFELIIKKIFIKKTLSSKEKLKESSGIVISDTILKFHDNDKRAYWREKVNKK